MLAQQLSLPDRAREDIGRLNVGSVRIEHTVSLALITVPQRGDATCVVLGHLVHERQCREGGLLGQLKRSRHQSLGETA